MTIELFVLCFDLRLLIIPVVLSEIKVREHRRDNQNRTIKRNRQHRVYKTKKNTIYVGHHYTKTNTNNVNIMRYIILDKCTYITDDIDTTVYSVGFRTNEALR